MLHASMTSMSYEFSWSNPNYELLSELGRGGMGVVYRAKRLSDQSILAVKVLPNISDPEFLIRFQRETQVLARLNHPHIVKVYDYGEQSSPFFAMEVMEGQDLKELFDDRMRQGGQPLEIDEAIALIAPIADALSHCHAQGIIHRDIKLSNIFVKSGGHPVLMDFGLSKQNNAGSNNYEKTLSKTGEILGTIAYMSPEQLSPKGDFGNMGPATDVWSLGTALFLLLTGAFPYPSSSAIELYMTIVEQDVPRLKEQRPDAPDWLDDLLHQMLSKHATDRPSMEQVTRSLKSQGHDQNSSVMQSAIQPSVSPLGLSLSNLGLMLCIPALCVLAFLLWQKQGQVQIQALDPVPLYVSSKTLTLKGKLSEGPVTIMVGERKDVSRVDGRFELSIPLAEGSNLIELTFSNGRGPDLTRSYTVRRDTKPPVIQWALPKVKPETPSFSISDRAALKGSVIETSLDFIEANQTKLSVRDGQFVIPSSLWEKSPGRLLIVRARDKAGLEVERRIRVRPSLLSDHERWRHASELEQDHVIEELILRLRAPFQFLGMQVYECGGRRYRIPRFLHKKTALELHLVPGGSFAMGIPSVSNEVAYMKRVNPQESQERLRNFFGRGVPQHRVSLKPFLIAPFELTEEQWSKGKVGRVKPTPNRPKGRLNRPLILEWLGDFPSLRLPSEAEWEYAARAGSTTRYFWGDEFKGRYVWYARNSGGRMHLITEHAEARNAFGLADVIGNAWELVADDYRANYKVLSKQQPYFHPKNPGRGTSCFRGGGFPRPVISNSLSLRLGFETKLQGADYGVRLAASFDKVFRPRK